MVTSTQQTSSRSSANGNGGAAKSRRSATSAPKRKSDGRFRKQRSVHTPSWLATAVSVLGVGVAIGAGLYATRKQWMAKAEEWRDDFAAAFADDETDYENFDQTRNAGTDSMRNYPGDEWEDIDDMSDASFPASDPPSFNPGKA
jgi:hypothetical protein